MKDYPKRRSTEVQLNVDLPEDVHTAIQDYAEREGVTRKQIVEIALRKFMVAERALKAEQRMRGKR